MRREHGREHVSAVKMSDIDLENGCIISQSLVF